MISPDSEHRSDYLSGFHNPDVFEETPQVRDTNQQMPIQEYSILQR